MFKSLWILFAFLVVLTYADDAVNQTSATTPTTSSKGPCMNTIPDCHYHRREEICEGIYKPWATARCSLYCGFCHPPENSTEECEDTIPNCHEFLPCDNPHFFVWVEDHCRKYCHHCGPTTASTLESSAPTTPQSTPELQPTATTNSNNPGSGPTVASTMSASDANTGEPTQQPTTATPTSTAAQPSCDDRVAFCGRYSKRACNDQTWAVTYCPRYCDVCSLLQTTTLAPTSTEPSTTQQATSATPDTETSATPDVETTHAPTVTSATTHASTTEGPPDSCQDQLRTCYLYSREACQDQQWGRDFCARFCNLCT